MLRAPASIAVATGIPNARTGAKASAVATAAVTGGVIVTEAEAPATDKNSSVFPIAALISPAASKIFAFPYGSSVHSAQTRGDLRWVSRLSGLKKLVTVPIVELLEIARIVVES
jgi:hypothetical protein